MKNEALTNTLIAVAIVAAVWLVAGLKVDLTNINRVIGFTTAGALLAMAPMAYRASWKNLLGR